MWKPDLCIYHGNCDDGFGAAYAVWKRWGDDVEFFPASYGKPPPDVTGKDVIMVDFSFKYPVMRELGNAAKSIVVLDHHKTAQAELHEWGASRAPENLHIALENTEFDIAHCLMQNCLPTIAWFDMEKSGARLAWEFCHPGLPVPDLIKHVEDRDLWRFALPYTRHVSAAVRSYKQTFDRWDAWIEAGDVTALVRDGGAILRAEQKLISQFMEQVIFDEIGGHTVPTVNVPYHFASDTANELLGKFEYAPFAAAWFRRGDGKFQVSLRSEDSRADVSEIAKLYGGGGHRNAAGFEVPSERDWKIVHRVAPSAGVTAPSEVDGK
jgi:hypothetical protein